LSLRIAAVAPDQWRRQNSQIGWGLHLDLNLHPDPSFFPDSDDEEDYDKDQDEDEGGDTSAKLFPLAAPRRFT
jgi:hypothetical protein